MVSKKLTLKEVEKVIIDLSDSGMTSEKIGLTLKQKYGIKRFKTEYKKKISDITGKKNADVKNIDKNFEKLKKHHGVNKKDQPAKRKLIKTAARLKKAKKYHSKQTS